ncbi:tyrosine-type recombinase/integrase [Metabacillus sp. KUDC1714]|uniref:Tyrosine-type recombinase/integrase n=1 Tax=Metabacillus elymi TaxID=2745198 RepID=A0ABX6SGS7_9BACI|nr:tyrosine-type recombinase/integrase [Metabacillus sp. KUDC1714]
MRPHDLRHTSATFLLSQGIDLKTVSVRLGHSTIRITADIYAHRTKETDCVLPRPIPSFYTRNHDLIAYAIHRE